MNTPSDQMQQPQQAPSVRVPKRFPLVTQPGFRSIFIAPSDPTAFSPVTDACLFNCYAELDPEDNQYWVQKRLGNQTLATQAGGGGGVGVGIFFNLAVPITIFGANLYGWNGGVFHIFTYAGTGHPLITGRAANFVQIPNGGVIWSANGQMWEAAFNPGTGIYVYNGFQDFVSGGVPWTANLCDGCAYLDQVVYAMDQLGNIWGSNINDITHWPATTLILAGGRNDIPVCLAQQLEYIVAFKSTSIRCFYDAGAAAQTLGVGSNLAWVEGADSNFGLLSAGALQLIDETLIWATNNAQGTCQVARMDGLKVSVISTPEVERLLQNVNMTIFSQAPNAPFNIVYSNGIKRGGHRFYTLTIPPASTLNGVGFTLVYDLDQLMWYVWSSPGKSYWSVVGTSSSAGAGAGVQGVFAQDINSGAFYLCDIDQIYPTDSGSICQVDIYTPNWDAQTRRRKQLNELAFVNDQVSGSFMQIRKSDDDYRSWSPFRQVSLASYQPRITRCGSFTRRAYNIRHAAAKPFRIKSGELQMDLGTMSTYR